MERDEVYVPKTRADLGIPKESEGAIDYEDYLGDTPIYTLFALIRQQVLAFPAYLREFASSYLQWLDSQQAVSIQRLRAEELPEMDQSLRSYVSAVSRHDPRPNLVHSQFYSFHEEAAQCRHHVEYRHRYYGLHCARGQSHLGRE